MSRAARSRRPNVRLLAGVPAVTLASSAAAVCIVHPYWLMFRAARYSDLATAFALYPVLGAMVAVGVFVLALLSSPILGPGPPTAVGAASAVFGLLVGRQIRQGEELLFVCLALGIGCGALAAGGLIEASRAGRARPLLLAVWVLPFMASWPWTTWSSLHQVLRTDARVVPGVSIWVVVAWAGLLVAWSVYALLTDAPGRPPGPALPSSGLGVEVGIGVAAAVAALFAVVLTIDVAAFPSAWIRPLVLAGSAVSSVVLVAAGVSPSRAGGLRVAYLGVVAPCLLAPGALTFAVAQGDRPGRGLGLGPLVVLTAVAVVVSLLAARRLAVLVVAWPALAAIGAIVAWSTPSADWLMVLVTAVLLAGLAGSAGSGLAIASEAETWVLGFAALVSVLIGTSFIPGLLTAGLTGVLDPRADGRVAFGVTLAGFIAVTAATHLASRQSARRRVTRETGVTIP